MPSYSDGLPPRGQRPWVPWVKDFVRRYTQFLVTRMQAFYATVGVDHEERIRALEARYVRHGVDWDDLKFVTPKEMAAKFSLREAHVHKMIREGKIPCVRFGMRNIRVPCFWLVDRIAVPVEQYKTVRSRHFDVAMFEALLREGFDDEGGE